MLYHLNYRLSQLHISVLLTMELDYLGANMTQLPGWRDLLGKMNGYGETLHTH